MLRCGDRLGDLRFDVAQLLVQFLQPLPERAVTGCCAPVPIEANIARLTRGCQRSTGSRPARR